MFLIEAPAEGRPDDLAEVYVDALASGANWRQRIGASLERIPRVAGVLAGLTGT